MRLSTFFIFGILSILSSCHGQTTTQTANPQNSESLNAKDASFSQLGDNIMAVYQDTKNNYWFGSWKDGLYKFDGKSIIHYTTKDGLPSNRVEEIKEDKHGNLYFNTSKGLCQFDGDRLVRLTEAIPVDGKWNLYPDDLWFKCLEYDNSVYRFDGTNLYRLEVPKTEIGEEYVQKHPEYSKPYAIYCIYKDSKGNIWFGTAVLGAFRYDGKSFDWISEQDLTELHNGPSNGVRSIAEDKNGNFWFNTAYKYEVYNKNALIQKSRDQNANFYDRIKSIGCLDGKKDGDLNEFLSIIKDDNGNLWIATYLHGVWKYDGDSIEHYPIQVNNKNIPVYCLYQDKKGDIWLGTEKNGVYKFDGMSFERRNSGDF
jgi:ligand-binding sensor domain-containing protein